ncbi:MAG: hypothetical protein ACKO1I_13885 [Microcystis aeruginosa]
MWVLKPFVAAHKHGINAIGAAGGIFLAVPIRLGMRSLPIDN